MPSRPWWSASESGKGLRKLGETVVECPACGNRSLRITDYEYDVPLVGKVILSSGKCEKCGYRYSDVRLAESKGPRRIVLPIERCEDLNTLVVRASSATIRIPEKGLEMRPGPAAQGFITTVEGVLDRFLEALHVACREAPSPACSEVESWLRGAKECKEKFTLVIDDPEGVSTVVSEKARIEPLD